MAKQKKKNPPIWTFFFFLLLPTAKFKSNCRIKVLEISVVHQNILQLRIRTANSEHNEDMFFSTKVMWLTYLLTYILLTYLTSWVGNILLSSWCNSEVKFTSILYVENNTRTRHKNIRCVNFLIENSNPRTQPGFCHTVQLFEILYHYLWWWYLHNSIWVF